VGYERGFAAVAFPSIEAMASTEAVLSERIVSIHPRERAIAFSSASRVSASIVLWFIGACTTPFRGISFGAKGIVSSVNLLGVISAFKLSEGQQHVQGQPSHA
jgi:hypothetical protein